MHHYTPFLKSISSIRNGGMIRSISIIRIFSFQKLKNHSLSPAQYDKINCSIPYYLFPLMAELLIFFIIILFCLPKSPYTF